MTTVLPPKPDRIIRERKTYRLFKQLERDVDADSSTENVLRVLHQLLDSWGAYRSERIARAAGESLDLALRERQNPPESRMHERAWVAAGGRACPACGAPAEFTGASSMLVGALHEAAACERCGAQWERVLRVSGYRITTAPRARRAWRRCDACYRPDCVTPMFEDLVPASHMFCEAHGCHHHGPVDTLERVGRERWLCRPHAAEEREEVAAEARSRSPDRAASLALVARHISVE